MSQGNLETLNDLKAANKSLNQKHMITDKEFELIKNHPVMGARILKNIKEMPKLVTGARWHHERYGGGGYPDNLSGNDIPEAARIIAVADTTLAREEAIGSIDVTIRFEQRN